MKAENDLQHNPEEQEEEIWPDVIGASALSDIPPGMLSSEMLIKVIEWRLDKQAETCAQLGDRLSEMKEELRVWRRRAFFWRDVALIAIVVILFLTGWLACVSWWLWKG